MKWKNLAIIVMSALFVFALAGCGGGSSQPSSSTQENADALFITDLGKALEARWAVTDNPENTTDTIDKEKEVMGSAVQAELSILGDYTSAKFEDSGLQAKAIDYINCLKDQQASLDYISIDYTKYDEEWHAAYDKRTQLIKDFVDDYGLTVSEANNETLKELVTNASLVNDKEAKQAAVDKICKSMKFEAVNADEYDHTYAAVVKNSSDVDFKTFSVVINLLDKDGVIVESTYGTVNNWGSGDKAKFDFWYDGDFSKIKVKSDYWEEAK